MALSPEERTLRASIAAHEMHARHDGREITARARAAWFAKFLAQVPADLPEAERVRRAEHLMRAAMKRLALKSAKARRRRKQGAAAR